jgi:hypothetical protein
MDDRFTISKGPFEDPPQFRNDPPIFELRKSKVSIAEFMVPVRISLEQFCESTNLSAQQVRQMMGEHGLHREIINGSLFIVLDDKAMAILSSPSRN